MCSSYSTLLFFDRACIGCVGCWHPVITRIAGAGSLHLLSIHFDGNQPIVSFYIFQLYVKAYTVPQYKRWQSEWNYVRHTPMRLGVCVLCVFAVPRKITKTLQKHTHTPNKHKQQSKQPKPTGENTKDNQKVTTQSWWRGCKLSSDTRVRQVQAISASNKSHIGVLVCMRSSWTNDIDKMMETRSQ